MKSLAAVSLILFFATMGDVALFGQLRAQLSPFPAWPADGNVPDHLKNNYVFVGPRVGQITVAYPASLDNPNQTGLKTFTFDLHNLVEPIFSVQMRQHPNGTYAYEYLLRNRESAQQPIRIWSFVGPASDSVFEVSGPGWSAIKVSTVSARQIALPSVPELGAEVKFYSGAGNEIQPGGSLDRFHVRSTYSPGFTTAFVRSGAAFDLPGQLPKPVADQVGVLQKLEWNSRVAVILGPRFAPGTSVQAIAADFHVGINRLMRQGMVSGDSPFVREALARLAWAIEVPEGTPSLREVVKMLPKPSPGIESEIAQAMEISPK